MFSQTVLQLGLDADRYLEMLADAVVTILIFVVAFAVFYSVGKALFPRIVRESLSTRDVDETIVGLGASVTLAITAVLAVALAATVAGFGVVLSAFAILGGALALAVGFAAQNLIANFIAGVFIIQDDPFVVGDWIEWDDNAGIVREIQLRVTKVDTFDEELVTVPNVDLANNAVTNPVANDRLRVSYPFGIGYGDDIEEAREIILKEAAAIEGVLDDPAPSAPVVDLGDSAVVLSGRMWVNPKETGAGGARAQLIEAVKRRFDERGIDIPYPNTELSGRIEVA
ncbi:MAG: mechanosensitive ion channel family protein [Halobacteriota archaeon]